MKLKKGDYTLIIICVIIVLITFLLIGFNDKKGTTINNSDSNKVSYYLLDDYSRFFTLESCIYKFIVYLQSKNVDSLLKLLDSEYVEKNSINSNNVLEFLGYLDGVNTFKAKKIYYENVDNNIVKYYVYGQIIEETIDTYNSLGKDVYYIVYMDIRNMTYSIEPLEKSIFSEVSNG